MDSQPDQGRDLTEPTGKLLRGAPGYEPRTPWPAARALLATVVIIAASIGFALAVLWLLGSNITGMSLEAGDAAGDTRAGLHLFALWQAGTVLLTLLAASLLGGRVSNVLALGPVPDGWRSYALALVALALVQTAVSAVQFTTRTGDLYVDLRPFVDLVRGPDWLLAAAVIGIGAPLSEELLFRGFLLSALAKTRVAFWGAAVISSGLWTLLHAGYSAVGILEVFLIGLFFSWLLWRTGSLRVPIFCHAVYNSLIVLALRFADLPAPG